MLAPLDDAGAQGGRELRADLVQQRGHMLLTLRAPRDFGAQQGVVGPVQ